jgi:hypothetical protein
MLYATEDECACCSRLPAVLRPMLRIAIDQIPLREPVCDACLEAFWKNVKEGEPMRR